MTKDSPSRSPAAAELLARPPPCPECAAPRWWNGWRLAHIVTLDASGATQRVDARLHRAKCSKCRRSITCRPDDLYPRRQYQLDAVASVVAAVSLGDVSAPAAAEEIGASATSARRWTGWVAALIEPAVVLRLVAQVDPEAPAGSGLSRHAGESVRARAARVLDTLEQLGAALVRKGVVLAARSGLGRVLAWQWALFGDVVGVVAEPKTLSPRMARDGGPGGR